MSDRERDAVTDASADASDRRRFLRIGAATAIGGLVLSRAAFDLAAGVDGASASVSSTCHGCTGCAAVCPEAAITVLAGRIEIAQAKCVRCGYCVAVCPVEGVLVHREDGRE